MTAPQVTPNFKAPKKKKGRGGMYGTGPKGRATKLHAELVRARGACQGCGSVANLQCCHILTRKFAATRTDETNAVCGCASCHAKWTDNPLMFGDFVRALLGEDELRRIQAKAYAGVKANDAFWNAEIARLERLLGAVR